MGGLTNPTDIERQRKFAKDVDALRNAGYIRHYTAEISAATGESKGNITSFYKGVKPIGDNFLKKFDAAYKQELKVISAKEHAKSLIEEPSTTYSSSDPRDEHIDTLKREVVVLEGVIESYQQIINIQLPALLAALLKAGANSPENEGRG